MYLISVYETIYVYENITYLQFKEFSILVKYKNKQ